VQISRAVPNDRFHHVLQARIPALDGVRGVAAATVFVYHYGGGAQSSFLPLRWFGEGLKFGWVGVSLFFVLSGFLISGILWDSMGRPSWWQTFYVRRSLRIFPLYYLALLLAVAIALLAGQVNVQSSVWPYALYLQNIPSLGNHLHGFDKSHLDHFWTLAVEEQFYLVWPFLLLVLRRDRVNAMRFCTTLWLLSFIFRLGVYGFSLSPDWAGRFLLGRTGELSAGAFLALSLRGSPEERRRLMRQVPRLLWGALAALVVLLVWSHEPSLETFSNATFGLAVLSIFFGCLIAYSTTPGPAQSFFELPALRWLGKISYGIYVYHVFFRWQFEWCAARLAPHAGRTASLALVALVAAVGTLAVATLSFYAFEQPFLSLRDRFHFSHARAPVQVPSPV
jgi:peptidoglycan/LPS O-acetylase OafA/YrhL